MPAGADKKVFGEGVREAARIYAREARTPNANSLNDEVAGLHRAADQRLYAQVVDLLERLSPHARGMLIQRGSQLGIDLPEAEAVFDNDRRDNACAAIVKVCMMGAQYAEGRSRPKGKRSAGFWRPVLYAPDKQRNFTKRTAERNFLMWLRLAWLEATGNTPPADTARPADAGREIGPFARMLKECLCLLGAQDADPVELINELHRRRRLMSPRETSPE
jgi:hypothetical protein